MVKLKRTAPRRWLGNGMGYDPAEYAIVNDYGIAIGRVQFYGSQWHVVGLGRNNRDGRSFDYFRDARKFALANF